MSTQISMKKMSLEEKEVEMELLTDVDMLLMVEKIISSGVYHAKKRNAKVKNKYMIDYGISKNGTKIAGGWLQVRKRNFRFNKEVMQN